MTDEERIRAYLRRRAEVSVPDDLRWPATATPRRTRRWVIAGVRWWGRLAVAGLVTVLLIVGVSMGLPTTTGPGLPSGPPSGPPASGTTGPTGIPVDAVFPSEVGGLPVISVADAVGLLGSGKLDGRAVAVAGYFDEFAPSCPAPMGYIGPLEGWCQFVAFTDSRAAAKLCTPDGTNGFSCREPSGTYLAPFAMSETSGFDSIQATETGPVALVLIGHAGDPRQWQCTAATQAACAHAFVVDRVAWSEGHDVPVAAPKTGDRYSGAAVNPRMALSEVATSIGLGEELVTGAAFKAGDIATVDPRWNLAGDNIVWLVRSLGQAGASVGDARPETVWLVDDATGHIIDSHPLQLASDYQPARLWPMATVHGVDCCASDVTAFYRAIAGDGTTVYEGLVSGGSSGEPGVTTFGGGYGSGVLVLPAGGYTITAWLATYDQGAVGTPRNECSTQVTLSPLGDVVLNADFQPNQACTFQPGPAQSSIP